MISFDDLLEKESKSFNDYKFASLEVTHAKIALDRARMIKERERAEHQRYSDAITAHFMGYVDLYLKAEDK